ncbi:MAG: mycofactocin biosynthesis FMN-dependent deaminase MftD [Acidimicrobiia bacterium]|nr:mycofactocin biosynthesis FMN-dependent deaminase MftD [Acidimicrobiia bacterium]MCY4457541.1 mycofactocin biosynthesis FMN-dependent deaminase MftD [Acidimicrobiaceae bacterium]
MSNKWFETVAQARQQAKKRLPKSVYAALIGGTEAGVSLRDNVSAFEELGLRPITAGQIAEPKMAVTVMGQRCAMPVIVSPTGVQAVHPQGEVALAQAANSRGTPIGLSAFSSKPIEEVVAANPQTFFQVYWAGDRDFMLKCLERAANAGAAGLIVTLDWSFSHGRDWGSPHIPQSLTAKEVLPHSFEIVTKLPWCWSWLRAGALPRLQVPNFAAAGEPEPRFFEAYGTWLNTPPPTWDDVRWLRSQWEGPFMVKGISRADEARHAIAAGATAISVSNHGGNNLDSAVAPIRVLPEIADAVGGEVEILLDGGVRRGSDVVKACALGADAVLIGRALLWGLAANGAVGVENVLDIFHTGIKATLRGIGKENIAQVGVQDVVVPPGFYPPPCG